MKRENKKEVQQTKNKTSWWDEWQAAVLFNSQNNLNTDILNLIIQNLYIWKLL